MVFDTQNFLMFRPEFGEFLEGTRMWLCDVGARGDLVDPWRTLERELGEHFGVVGFEPDAVECKRLQDEYGERRRYVAKAVWSSPERRTVYISKSPSQSSMWPPNLDLLKARFPRRRWNGRQTRREVEVDCTTLDAAATECGVSFDHLKIDTQGSEFEILAGAREVLDSVFACSAESWFVEVYRGQKLAPDVMKQMYERGFELFRLEDGGSWRRRLSEDRFVQMAQPVQVDLLFLKTLDSIFSVRRDQPRIVIMAATAELWGFPDFALEILEVAAGRNELDESVAARAIECIRDNRQRVDLTKRVLPRDFPGLR